MIRQRPCPSPLGVLTVVASPAGLVAVLWPDVEPAPMIDLDPEDGEAVRESVDALLDRAVEQFDEYFAGTRRQFELELAPVGTPFQLAVWEVLRSIPYGATMTYREQAEALGDPAKARAVGSANGRNPLSIVVPCHRVVASGGGLGGFAGGLDAKSWLLAHERRVLATTP